jgi:hypothetical protein
MDLRNPSWLLKWVATVAMVGNLLVLAYWVNEKVRARRDAETPLAKKPDREPGDVILPTRVAESLLLELEKPRLEERWIEPLTVYGQVVPNPLATVEVRSPFAGTLREGSGAWPQPGQWLKAGHVLGWVDIRVGPQDRLDLQNKRNEAERKHKGALETLQLKKANLDRFEATFRDRPKSISLKELEEARQQYSEAVTSEALARDAVNLWHDALADIDRVGRDKLGKWSQALKVPAAGEVTDLVGRSGTAVEAGGVVLRLVDFRRPLVRLDLPPEVVMRGPPRSVDLFALSPTSPALHGVLNQPQSVRPAQRLSGHLTGAAPAVNAASQFGAYLYEIDGDPARAESETSALRPEGVTADGLVWRPGLLVKASLPGFADPQTAPAEAISVPAKAVLFHQGRALIYILRRKDDKSIRFSRFEVQILGRKEERWVLAMSQHVDDQVEVVVNNAQALLSEEFKADIDED